MKKKFYFKKLKRIAKICCLSAGLLTSTVAKAQDVTSGLMMYYNFESFSGTTVPDASGNSLNGTLQGAATLKTAYSGLGLQCTLNTDYNDQSGYFHLLLRKIPGNDYFYGCNPNYLN